MAKVGTQPEKLAEQLAQDLGRKPASTALAELLAGGTDAAHGADAAAAGWRVPDLPRDFLVDAAVQHAMDRAARYLNYRMQGEGVVVEVQQHEAKTRALVRENAGERVIRHYDGDELLRFYALQAGNGRGVVVDGSV